MGCSSSKLKTAEPKQPHKTKSERLREANRAARDKNLQRGKTAMGHDHNIPKLQFAGDGSLIVPPPRMGPSDISYGLAAMVAM